MMNILVIWLSSFRKMRYCLFLLLLITVKSGFSQDTLIYKNGKIENVHVLMIDDNLGFILTLQKQDTLCISKTVLKEYYIHSDIKHDIPDNLPRLAKKSHGEFTKNYSFFERPAKYTYGKVAISTNLAGFFAHSYNGNTRFFSNNRALSLESEYFFSHKFSIKMPVTFGLNQQSFPINESSYDLYYYDPYSGNTTPTLYFIYNNHIDYTYNSDHGRELKFQIGIYPKFFPWGDTKNAFYLAQGFNIGIGDYYTFDYHHHYNRTSWVDQSTGQLMQSWEYISGTKTGESNPSIFFRYEFLTGINFNISKSVCFAMETGLSSTMGNHGKEKDNYYLKLNNNDYYLYASLDYESPQKKVIGVFRVFLVIRWDDAKK